MASSDRGAIREPGFVVERVETRAEGICRECTAYDGGLRAGARAIIRSGPGTDTLLATGTAVSELDSPLGGLLMAATPRGLTRLAFDDHADVATLRAHAATHRGSQAARRHLAQATTSLSSYFAGKLPSPTCVIDWEQLPPDAPVLRTTHTIAYASHGSYSALDYRLSARDLGRLFGRNPIPVFMPCHRVRRGHETPTSFVGGAARREWLMSHEQTHPLS